jgi:DNA modification methylase
VKPYYERGGITIYQGDSREVLPTLPKMSAVVTDPPYGIGMDGRKFSTHGHGGWKAYEYLGWDAERPDAELFALILKAAPLQIIWGGNYFADLLPATGKWLVWDKQQRISQSDGELAWTSMPGALRIFTANRCILLQDGTDHPTQKPVKLMRWCLEQLPAECNSILDPFLGSGTTLIAAKELGFAATGIEREEKYCEIAARRVDAVVSQVALLPELEFIQPALL